MRKSISAMVCAVDAMEHSIARLKQGFPLRCRPNSECLIATRIGPMWAGGCASLVGCCGGFEKGAGMKYMSVDHNHETGEVRGVLCHPCNLGSKKKRKR